MLLLLIIGSACFVCSKIAAADEHTRTSLVHHDEGAGRDELTVGANYRFDRASAI